MMSRKYALLFAAIVMASTASMVVAQSTIVIGDFEGLANNTLNPEGWTATAGTAASFNSPPAPAGVATVGTGAMSLVSSGFWALQYTNGSRPTLGADLLSHPILKFDVTVVPSQWADSTPADLTDNWARIAEKLAINDNTGWQEVGLTAAGDPANPGFPGGWDIDPSVTTPQTRTLTFDLRTDLNNNPMAIDVTGFVQLNVAANVSSTSFPQGGRFWIDNVRLIPEPASLSLAGLAGLVGFAMKRRFA